MLRINPLQPPRPSCPPAAAVNPAVPTGAGFISAEDYDATGVLAGLDPGESRYWWVAELYDTDAPAATIGQATHRSGRQPPTAA